MKNLLSYLAITLFICGISIEIDAQARLSMWRVAADHLDNHDHALVEEKIEYECGVYYYMIHTGEKVDMHLALRNDGDEDLYLESPVTMTALSSDFLQVTKDADKTTLAPGEETLIMISYLNTGEYVPGERGVISFRTNDFLNPMCGFSIEIGVPVESYCVCEDGELLTLPMMDGAVGEENGLLIPLKPNQFRLHSGPCNLMEDTCPDESSLSCYYTPSIPNFRTAVAGSLPPPLFPSAAEIYLELTPGYCPCILETDFCVSSQGMPTRGDETCVGDPETYEVINCWVMDNIPPDTDLRLPAEYNYEWCTDGIGTFDDNTGMTTTIEGWFPSDFIFVKVTNEEGCLGVGWTRAPQSDANELWITLEDQRPVCLQDDLMLCLNIADSATEDRPSGASRSDGVEWYTNGPGVFSNFTYSEGQHCVTISGMEFGDKVYALDYQGGIPKRSALYSCPPYGVYDHIEQGISPCTEAFENRGLGGISLDDPCSCEDPLNVPPPNTGTTRLFHDILTIENLLPFETVMITPGDNFLDDNGDPITPFNIDADNFGRIEYDFWHEPGRPGLAAIVPTFSESEMFTSSVCEACIPIPTMGQWGIIILSMLIIILGIVSVKARSVIMQ